MPCFENLYYKILTNFINVIKYKTRFAKTINM